MRGVTIVHLAAARNDHGFLPSEYFANNVTETAEFLHALSDIDISRFIHVSSVAAFDGSAMSYSEALNCDDAYRVTKYLQEKLIDWCTERSIPLTILVPSAIYDQNYGGDTNVARLVAIGRFLPVLPYISTKKSVTKMGKFCAFIADTLSDTRSGRFLCIEQPVQSVSEILQGLWPGKTVLKIPMLREIVVVLATLRLVPGLTKARAYKLFKDTDYTSCCANCDVVTYAAWEEEESRRVA